MVKINPLVDSHVDIDLGNRVRVVTMRKHIMNEDIKAQVEKLEGAVDRLEGAVRDAGSEYVDKYDAARDAGILVVPDSTLGRVAFYGVTVIVLGLACYGLVRLVFG